MADPLSIASGVAGLLSLAMEITKLSYGFICDIRSAHATQKQYLREVSALTDVLLRSEEAAQAFESQVASTERPAHFSRDVIDDCAKELDSLLVELAKPTRSIFWPIREKSLRGHIDELARIRQLFTAFLTAQTLKAASATHREVTRLGLQQSKLELLQWAGSSTTAPAAAPASLPGTGMWFLESDCFQAWVQGTAQSSLWCHGPPGVGKSVLASIVLQYLMDNVEGENRLVLHFFCDFATRKTQTKDSIWKSLLGQAITKGDHAVVDALTSFRSQRPRSDTASLKDLSDIWDSVLSLQQVILVIDGPDELDNPAVLKAVLAPFVKTSCRILVTSRYLPEIGAALPTPAIQEVLSANDDMEAYVVSQFEEYGMEEVLRRHPDLQAEVVEKSNRIFLLGRILVTQLLELSTPKEMRKALQSYPTQLEAAFEKSLERISAQSKSHSALALRVMCWIASTERPLLASELIHGLAVDQKTQSIDDEDMVSIKTILKVCGGLVVHSPDGHLALVHTTVHTWLTSRGLARTHEDVAGACLSYIALSVPPSGAARSAEDADLRTKNFPFLSYAAKHWRTHVSDRLCYGPPDTKDRLTAMVEGFFRGASLATAAFQVANFTMRSDDMDLRSATFDTMPTGQTTLHYVAFWDMAGRVDELLQAGLDIDAIDSQSWTPLHWAAFARKEATARVLLQRGAKVNARDSVGWTPLFWAALYGDEPIVRLLLENKAFHMLQDVHGWTPLRWAASRHQLPVMTVLFDHHTRTKEAIGRLPLRCLSIDTIRQFGPQVPGLFDEIGDAGLSFQRDREKIDNLHEILRSGSLTLSDLWKNPHFDPPVGNTWRTGTKAEIMFLIQNKSELSRNTKLGLDSRGWRMRLLRAAIHEGNLPAVQFLLALKAKPYSPHRLAPLLRPAAMRRDPRFIEMLLRVGVDVDSKDDWNMTPLQCALAYSSEETATLLVTKGANTNARGEKIRRVSDLAEKTPLVLALGRKCKPQEKIRLVQLLLEHGAHTNMGILKGPDDGGNETSSEPDGMTAIHYAAHTRCAELIQLVIQAGADPKALDGHGRTAIHHFVDGRTVPSAGAAQGRLPDSDSDALQLLRRECGMEYMNLTAEWETSYKTGAGWYSTPTITKHTPLSLSVAKTDWAMAKALQQLGALFQTSMPLDAVLMDAVGALEDQMVELLLQHGAQLRPDTFEDNLSTEACLDTLETIGDQGPVRLEATIRRIAANGIDVKTQTCSLLRRLVSNETEMPNSLRILLEAGAWPYIPNDDGFDCFQVAAIGGKSNILDVLLSHARTHPDPTHWTHRIPSQDHRESDKSGTTICCEALYAAGLIDKAYGDYTLLHKAAQDGNEGLLKALLQNHADPAIGAYEDRRPIHLASHQGNVAIIDLLMHVDGADANILDNGQKSPLHLAADNGHAEAIERLLHYGAAPGLVDVFGLSALHYAVLGNHETAAQTLLRVYPKAAFGQSQPLASNVQQRSPLYMLPDEEWGVTPLHIAALRGNDIIVRAIISAVEPGTDKNVRDLVRMRTKNDTGVPILALRQTALDMALTTGTFSRYGAEPLSRPRLKIASMLVEHGANVAGAADHLTLEHVLKFVEFPGLWDRLRVGITSAEE